MGREWQTGVLRGSAISFGVESSNTFKMLAALSRRTASTMRTLARAHSSASFSTVASGGSVAQPLVRTRVLGATAALLGGSALAHFYATEPAYAKAASFSTSTAGALNPEVSRSRCVFLVLRLQDFLPCVVSRRNIK